MLPTIIRRTPASQLRSNFGLDFDRLFEGLLDTRVTSDAYTASDLYETEDAYGVELDVPGFSEDEIDVTVDRGLLTISGAREASEEDEGRTYHMRERCGERFTRSFSLPASVRSDEVAADLTSGVLTIHLPKTPEAKPHRIAVGGKRKK